VIEPRSLFVHSCLLAAAAWFPLSAQEGPAAVPAAGGIGENVVKAETPPATVAPAAVAAVEKLGSEVVAGRYQITLDRMYPQWKDRLAKRAGGLDKLAEQLLKAPELLKSSGVALISSKPRGAPSVYEVGIGKKTETVNGRQVELMAYTKWLAIVPTATRMTISKDGKSRLVESLSFQVAISNKNANDWTFIDGSSLSLPDLRSLFPTFPDVQLPAVEVREIPLTQ
jgi:hypothetical protein